MVTQLQLQKPVIAQCHSCWKKYDMVKWGVQCPTCKDKPKEKKK